MCTLNAQIQCYYRFIEVFSDEVEYNELMIENAVSQLLLGFFEEVMVEVTIIFSPHLYMGLQHCSIQIDAQCESQTDVSLPSRKENIELTIENNMSSILRELFESVIVNNIIFIPFPSDYEFTHRSVGSV